MNCEHADDWKQRALIDGTCINCWKARAEKAEAESLALNETIGQLRERVTHSEQAALEMAEKLEKAESTCAEMRLALSELYKDTADYIAINHLGKVHHNRAMQLSRDALSTDAGKGWLSPEEAKRVDAKLEHQEDRVAEMAAEVDGLKAKLAIAVEGLEFPLSFNMNNPPTNAELYYYFKQVTQMCKFNLSKLKEDKE